MKAIAYPLLFLPRDGWADRSDVLGPLVNAKTGEHAYSRVAQGSFSIKLHSPKVPKFDDFFTGLTPEKHHDVNPWFTEFWEQKFNCTIRQAAASSKRPCTGKTLHCS